MWGLNHLDSPQTLLTSLPGLVPTKTQKMTQKMLLQGDLEGKELSST